jgi:hypothetical protein
MKASEADALILAFAQEINAQRILVIGSQAIHAHHANPPIDAVVESREVDLVPQPYADYSKWFYYAHERLGNDSEFDLKHGRYVDMVKDTVPKLPSGWEERAIERTLHLPDGRVVTAIYPELHDLIVTKLLAGRAQDEAFLRGVLKIADVSERTLRERMASVNLPLERESMRAWADDCLRRVFHLPRHTGQQP